MSSERTGSSSLSERKRRRRDCGIRQPVVVVEGDEADCAGCYDRAFLQIAPGTISIAPQGRSSAHKPHAPAPPAKSATTRAGFWIHLKCGIDKQNIREIRKRPIEERDSGLIQRNVGDDIWM
jgi:hypothetical protein